MATNKKRKTKSIGNLLPKTPTLAGRGRHPGHEQKAAVALGKEKEAEAQIDIPEVANGIVSEIIEEAANAGVVPGTQEYAELLSGIVEGAASNKVHGKSIEAEVARETIRRFKEEARKGRAAAKKAMKVPRHIDATPTEAAVPVPTPTISPTPDSDQTQNVAPTVAAIREEIKARDTGDQTQNVGPALAEMREGLDTGGETQNVAPALRKIRKEKGGSTSASVEKETKLVEAQTKNLTVRGKLIDLEEKQRKLVEHNMKDFGIQSKIMGNRANEALRKLSELDKSENETIVKMSEASMKVFEEIRDLMKAARTAGTAELSEIMTKLKALQAFGQRQAENTGDTAGYESIGKAAGIARDTMGRAPMPGLGRQLGDWAKGEAKAKVRDIYESTVPKPLRIVGEWAAGKLFNSQKKKEREAEVQGKYLADQKRIEQMREEEEDSRSYRRGKSRGGRDIGPRLVGGGFSTVPMQGGGLAANPNSGSNSGKAQDLTLGAVSIEKLEVKETIFGEDKDKKLQEESDKHNKARAVEGESGVGGLFSRLLSKVLGPFKPLLTAILTFVRPLGSLLLKLLAFLGAGLGKLIPGISKLPGALAKGGAAISKGVSTIAGKAGSLIKGAGAAAKVAGAGGALVAGKVAGAGAAVAGKVASGAGALAKGAGAASKVLGPLGAAVDVGMGASDLIEGKAQEDLPEGLDMLSPMRWGMYAGDKVNKAAEAGMGESIGSKLYSMFGSGDDKVAASLRNPAAKVMPPSNVAPPSAAIAQRTDMVDSVSRSNETMRDVRGAKPNVIINNVGGQKQTPQDHGMPIGMGSARSQENAFARYLGSTFAPM